jgi:hypothetical protein
MIASHLKTASALALFAVLGISAAEAQSRATRQIAVEPAQAAAPAEAQAPVAEAQASDPSAAQASPAPEAPATGTPAATAEAPAAEVPATGAPAASEATGAVPAQKPAPAAKAFAKPIVKVAAKPSLSPLRQVGYGGAGYGSFARGSRNCH